MTNLPKKFSQLSYQEELIQKLTSNEVLSDAGWIYFKDSLGKVWKINAVEADFIDSITSSTVLPKFSGEKVAVANIQEKEILLIDINAYIANTDSIYRTESIPANFKCITLKNESIGLLVDILASYIPNSNEVIEAIDIQKLLKGISENKGKI